MHGSAIVFRNHKQMRIKQALGFLLCCTLCWNAAPNARAEQNLPTGELNIIIVEGDGAINNVRQRTTREAIVQVEDENHRPVTGATVLFTLPSNGASGVFQGASQTFSALTNAKGQAVAKGLRPNNVSGNLQIRVDATYQGRAGHAVINQSNILKNAAKVSFFSTKTLVILAVAAGAAIAAGVCAANCGSGSSGTVITPGSGAVGAPH